MSSLHLSSLSWRLQRVRGQCFSISLRRLSKGRPERELANYQNEVGAAKDRRIGEGRKQTTLDDFFANLGSKPKERSSRNRKFRVTSENRSKKNIGTSTSPLPTSEVDMTKRVDMNKFFDEVNAMMKQKMAIEKKENDGIPKNEARSSSPMSILDLLPAARLRGPDAFDEDACNQYLDIMDETISDDTFLNSRKASQLKEEELAAVVDWLRAEAPVVKYSLPTMERLLEPEWEVDNLRQGLRKELSDQQSAFLEFQGWNQTQYQVAMRGLLRSGNLCAKKAIGAPAEIAWEKLKEAGFKMDQSTVQNFLYVTSTFCTRKDGSSSFQGASLLDLLGKPPLSASLRPVEGQGEESAETADVANEVALCHDVLFGSSEQSTSIRVRRLVAQKKAHEAEKLLDTNASDELRLRTYDPVFQCYLAQNDVASAFKLYVKMKAGDTVHLRPETYVQLISTIAENGFFRPGAPAIAGLDNSGYKHASGPKLFDRLAEELAEDTVEISAASAKRLYNSIVRGFENHNLQPLHLLQSLNILSERADASDLVASRVVVNETTGECPRTGLRLRLINLDENQKAKLMEGLHYLADTAYEERSGMTSSKAEENLRTFGEWLTKRSGKPFTAIVDGPNVGYYFQNFDQGIFNFHQIQFVVDALESMGENVLVILPKKYTQKSFMLTNASARRRQTLSDKEREICEGLVSSGKAFVVPPSFLDDYYWMYASVVGQGAKWTAEEQYVPPGNAEGRWPGVRPMLVSNDQMRDHKLSLLEPRLFRRWYSNFIVNFTFSAFVGDQCVDKEIGFRAADFYSREIQGNQVLDETGQGCGTAWHFPVSDWEDNECFCVRIPPR